MADQTPKDPPPIPGHVLDLVEQSQADTRAALDQLILEVETAKNVPLSNSVMLPREEFIERMRAIRSTVDRLLGEAVEGLPEELRAARWMVREREAYIARTNEKAKAAMDRANARAKELVSESNIIAEAVEAEMSADPAFRSSIEAVLDRRVKSKRKRAKLALGPAQGTEAKPGHDAAAAG